MARISDGERKVELRVSWLRLSTLVDFIFSKRRDFQYVVIKKFNLMDFCV